MTKKTLMIIGASNEHIIGIETAKRMGYKVFVTDGNPLSEGFRHADDFRVASTYDYSETFSAALDYISKNNSIDGVMTLASDIPYTVAYVANQLKLQGLSLEAALNGSEKMKMKLLFMQHSIPTSRFFEVLSKENIHEIKHQLDFPFVVKPADSRGARGVQLINSDSDIDNAFDIAIKYSTSKRLICEEYLSGPQLSTEGFMIQGEAYIPAIFDRNYEYLERFAPFFVENGGEMPSIYSLEYKNEVIKLMRDAAMALGIENGIIKGDLVIHNGKVKIIELAARMSGGFFGTVANTISTGVDLVKINIELAMGEKINPEIFSVTNNLPVAIRFAFPKPGRLKNVLGLEDITMHSNCCYAHVFKKGGDEISEITNHPDRPAVVVAKGESLKGAIDTATSLIDSLIWEYV